jgi:WD40 repeat protein
MSDYSLFSTITDEPPCLVENTIHRSGNSAGDWSGAPLCCAFHPSGRLLAIGYYDGTLMLWDYLRCAEDREVLAYEQQSAVALLAWSINNTLFTISSANLIRVWSLDEAVLGCLASFELSVALKVTNLWPQYDSPSSLYVGTEQNGVWQLSALEGAPVNARALYVQQFDVTRVSVVHQLSGGQVLVAGTSQGKLLVISAADGKVCIDWYN